MPAIANGFEQRVADARERFFDGNSVPLDLVSGSVVRSWERSRRLGLSMSSRSLFNAVSPNRQRGVEERARDLIGFAMPEMERLLGALSRADWTLACVDRDGVVIAAINTPAAASGLRSAFRTGVELGENAVGTTAPGCALRERKPIAINANEHFLDDLRSYSCIAVPIFDPNGELAGAIDASCSYVGNPLTAMEPIFVAARSVENRMVQAIPASVQIAVHYRADMLGTPLEGVLAFSEDGRLLGMNQVAQRMLGLDTRPAGLDFAALFDGSFARARDALRHPGGTPLVLENRAGARLLIGRRERSPVQAGTRHVSSARTLPERESAPTPAPGSGDAIVERASLIARRALARDIPVLINGETGTGKDVLARHIHDQGARSAGPFVAVNCSAIPAGLIESELFGYEDGAFTGGRRGGAAGRFEQACGGTLFLDEIGDMPLDLQARLLRVLQERNLTRVGGSRPIALDAAVVCATHRDLKTLVARGAFREDLYYRINGLRITLPPLRERPDRRALIESLLARESGGRRLPISAEAMDALLAYTWPGNIRQLQHAIRLAVVLAEDDGRIERFHLHEDILDAQPVARPAETAGTAAASPLEQAERDVIRATLERHAGNVSAAARELGIGRETLYRRLRTLGLVAGRRSGPDHGR